MGVDPFSVRINTSIPQKNVTMSMTKMIGLNDLK